MSQNKSLDEMDYTEFCRWAQEYVMDGFLSAGLKGMKSNIEMVIQQTSMVLKENKGKFGKTAK